MEGLHHTVLKKRFIIYLLNNNTEKNDVSAFKSVIYVNYSLKSVFED